MGNTYQYIQRPVLLLEGLSKLPNLTRFLHVDNMNVHVLITSRWNPGPLSQVSIFSILKPLTVFPDSLTITSLAASALSLFLHTMWTVPPGNTRTRTHTIINEGCSAESKPQPTFLGHSHGGRPADSAVGSSDHEGPSHHGHVQVLGVEAFRCGFVSLPKDAWEKTSK